MPLLRQLEFAFQTKAALTSILSLRERRTTESPGEGHFAGSSRNVDLETKAHELLRVHGANRIARVLGVEWNSRLKTAAGRADYRQKFISLNPRLIEHPNEIDRLCATSWRTSSPNFALAGRGFHLTAASGSRPAWIWESPTRSAVTICRSQSVNVLGAIYTGVQVAGAIFLVCAGSNVQLHVWSVAALITAADSMRVFDCGA